MMRKKEVDLKSTPVALAIGTFDGVHRGHQKICETLQEVAKRKGIPSVVITFRNNPKAFLSGEDIPMVLSLEDKVRLIRDQGMNAIRLVDFDDKIRRMSQREFLQQMDLTVEVLVVGYDFQFGRQDSREDSFPCEMIHVEPVRLDGEIISSTLLRDYLQQGKMDAMRRALGRWHFYSGQVIHGAKRGTKLGFPTLNLTIQPNLYSLRRGVYISQTLVRGVLRPSVTNVGHNPTFRDKSFTIETYLLDFEGELYDEKVEVHFLHFLREEIVFESPGALSAQIAEDVMKARKCFQIEMKREDFPWTENEIYLNALFD